MCHINQYVLSQYLLHCSIGCFHDFFPYPYLAHSYGEIATHTCIGGMCVNTLVQTVLPYGVYSFDALIFILIVSIPTVVTNFYCHHK